MGDNETEIAGTLPQRIYSCLATLDQFLNQSYPVMSSFTPAERVKKVADGAGQGQGLVSAVANILGENLELFIRGFLNVQIGLSFPYEIICNGQ